MKRRIMVYVAAVIMAATLGGCDVVATANKPVSVQTAGDARSVIAGIKSGYGALLIAITEYNRLPPCGQANAPVVCSSRPVVIQLSKAQIATSATINNAEQAILDAKPGDTTYLNAAVNAAQAAYDSFKAVAKTYNVGDS